MMETGKSVRTASGGLLAALAWGFIAANHTADTKSRKADARVRLCLKSEEIETLTWIWFSYKRFQVLAIFRTGLARRV